MNTTERFWAKVEIIQGTNCLRWTGCPLFRWGDGRTNTPQRFAWELLHGPAPKGKRLRRTCDTPHCVNGSHWELLLPPERFMLYVKKTAGCWLWTGDTNKPPSLPYGRFSEGGKGHLAHRFSFELTNGPIPDGLLVCHHCDNPLCVRPDHLFLGTDADNFADMKTKGRSKIGAGYHSRFKLSPDDVKTIRRSRAGASALAARFGVATTTIYHIRRRQTWKDL